MMSNREKLFFDYQYKQYQNELQKLDKAKLAVFFNERFEKKSKKIELENGIASVTHMKKFSDKMGFDIFLLGDILTSHETEENYRLLLREMKKEVTQKNSVIVAKEPIDNVILNNSLLKEGFYYVCGESVFTLNLGKINNISHDGFNYVRPAVEADIPSIRKLSYNAHEDIRYYCDPHFDKKKVGAFYEDIVSDAVSLKNQFCFVYEEKGQVEGFITVLLNEGLSKVMERGYGSLDYISVDPAKQKKGMGFILNNYAIDFLKNEGHEICVVKTMASNYRAIRLLIKNHFVLSSQSLVYHCLKD